MIEVPRTTFVIRTKKDGSIDMRWKGAHNKPHKDHPWKRAWSIKRMKVII